MLAVCRENLMELVKSRLTENCNLFVKGHVSSNDETNMIVWLALGQGLFLFVSRKVLLPIYFMRRPNVFKFH